MTSPIRRLRRRWQEVSSRDARYRRSLARATVRDVTPPPPAHYGAHGRDTHVIPPARVSRPDRIFLGDGVVIHEHAWLSVVESVSGVEPTLTVGDRTSIGRFNHIACVGSITIGDDVLTSERVFIGDTYHGYEDPATPIIRQPMAHPEPVVIEDGAFLGIGCCVLLGVTVGAGAYVGAGAVVTTDVPPRTLVVGNPARVVKRYDEETSRWVSVDG